MNNDNIKKYALLLISIFSFFLGVLIFFQVYIDDAFIFFKYGYNLVNHGIWSWSIEGKPAEAYTSFIYAVLSIFPALLHVPPHIFIKVVGLLFLLALLFRVYSKISNKKWALIAMLVITTNWQLYTHAFSGLETVLWLWLLLESFFLIEKEELTVKNQMLLWSICLLMTLTRPEGAIYGFFFFVYLVFYKKQKLHFGVLATLIFIGILYFAARFAYFGLPFPLPFYHKLMDSRFAKLAWIFNIYTSWYYIICATLVLYFFRKHKVIYFIGIITFLIFIGLYLRAFLVMNFADRFPFQLFWPFILFALIKLEKSTYVDKVKIVLIACFLNMIIFSKGLYDENLIELASITNNAGAAFFLPRSHYILAKNINKIKDVERKKLKVLFGDAGMFPYYVKAQCYDYNGLVDAEIAINKLDKKYFYSKQADIVLIGTPNENKIGLKQDLSNCKTIYEYAESDSTYKYVGKVISKVNGYYVHIYFNTKSSYAKDVETALNNAVTESANAQFRIKRFLKLKYLDLENI
ncbi:MAG TPA: hypothetical protein PKK18_10855 [Chitinophagales bacterium]|nr:hypothetical protein [Chitinophagales bacterium]HMW13126.1 hypothetical protein [Chitinophagales bacterium]HMX61096.1 hypothetical protein [Chitinophagales bacterium]HMY23518.1 hypothetical protein [Chitinophagales bacterium]HMZ33580.1 hypothetical protein [Chitinophagales bacterium]